VNKYEITIDGTKFVVSVGDVSASPVQVIVNGEQKTVAFREAVAAAPVLVAPATAPTLPSPVAPTPEPEPVAPVAPAGAAKGQVVAAPMPGKILSITVKVGDAISEGDTVCTLEAMKMEMPISCTASGTVQAIQAQVGATVAFGDPLVTIG
jgi:glutaconyl-CoA decarboxylase